MHVLGFTGQTCLQRPKFQGIQTNFSWEVSSLTWGTGEETCWRAALVVWASVTARLRRAPGLPIPTAAGEAWLNPADSWYKPPWLCRPLQTHRQQICFWLLFWLLRTHWRSLNSKVVSLQSGFLGLSQPAVHRQRDGCLCTINAHRARPIFHFSQETNHPVPLPYMLLF